MNTRQLEVADVFREHADKYLRTYGATTAQRQVLHAVQNCRTAVLGGHVEPCDRCGRQQIADNSCRNRHCPKCQGVTNGALAASPSSRAVSGGVLSSRLFVVRTAARVINAWWNSFRRSLAASARPHRSL